ncbi:MAG: efflux RND transporter periplasmic adaptor subunit [Betaproteobacteria bacterium]|nr:MAG: efflux RND transporter periplasmic adaptor subunit [Betaproteobacteria bacterium]
MKKRMVIMLVIVGVLLGGLVGFNFFKGYMMQKYMAGAPIPASTVTAMTADYQQWQPQLAAVGTLRAVRGVDVTTEVAGLVRSVNFQSGDETPSGKVLAELNVDSDVAQLHALQAAADLAKTVYDRDKAQLDIEVISKAQVDADAADLKSKQAQVAQQQALIDKKSIRAPFAGKLGISTVNPGQYLNPGDKLVTLQTIDPIYIDFYLPQQQLPQIAIGQKVSVSADAYKGMSFPGKINAINPRVDPSTRNVQVEATIPNAKRQLLPGMFANVKIDTGDEQRYLTLPQTAITYNPYGNTVFVIKPSEKKDEKGNAPMVAQQVFVTTGPTRGDQIAILKGVEPGAQVVTSGQVKLKNGSPVIVNNSVQPTNSPNPTPQEQ